MNKEFKLNSCLFFAHLLTNQLNTMRSLKIDNSQCVRREVERESESSSNETKALRQTTNLDERLGRRELVARTV